MPTQAAFAGALALLAGCDRLPEFPGSLVLRLEAPPAEHQPFPVQVALPGCGPGSPCPPHPRLTSLSARCEDPAVCSVQGPELAASGERALLWVDAHQAGGTLLWVEAQTDQGPLPPAVLPLEVVSPASLDVECRRCQQPLPEGQEALARCSLRGPEPERLRLRGSCDALGQGVDIRAAGPPVPPGRRPLGTVFRLRKTTPGAARVEFSSGEIRQVLTLE